MGRDVERAAGDLHALEPLPDARRVEDGRRLGHGVGGTRGEHHGREDDGEDGADERTHGQDREHGNLRGNAVAMVGGG